MKGGTLFPDPPGMKWPSGLYSAVFLLRKSNIGGLNRVKFLLYLRSSSLCSDTPVGLCTCFLMPQTYLWDESDL